MKRSASGKCAAGAVGAVVLMAALSGCGGDRGGEVPKTATGSLEQLASKVKCRPDLQTDAQEIRQANCRTGDGRFVLATFATDRGQREWLNEAKDYGGSYLVGRKWIAVGESDVVTALRGRLGGDLEESSHHMGTSGGGSENMPSEHPSGHSGHTG
ncbi:hypothetical protein ACFVT5_35620 [Streptomyces sp. NPDC058001]|uniref:hypothetical protein n=1 Tax=Streptomyces sp. NPDC058001 TaxID=3346300 RepID=UPI0036EC6929